MGWPAVASAQDEIFAETEPVSLNLQDEAQEEIGELIYRGGLEIASGDENIGGISGLTWHEDRLYAVSDDGHWLTVEPDEIDGQLIDLLSVERGRLLDERGKRLRGQDRTDAEAIAPAPLGGWIVTFERQHRALFYQSLTDSGVPTDAPEIAAALELVSDAQPNNGLETFHTGRDAFIACAEQARVGEPNCVRVSNGVTAQFELPAPPALVEQGGAPTDATCLEDGTCFVLFRSFREGDGNRAAIVKLGIEGEPETLAVFTPPLTLDNFEGLAVREQFGRTYLYVVSDNNFSGDQRTLLMKFEIKVEDPPIEIATPEPVIEYETRDIVMETTKGNITIRLEVERAPITAANFLAYVDEGRFDGTNFYRSLKFRLEPRPYGLIQGGTRYDRKRLRPNIAHEPTNVTGLSHTNGAVSMARLEPGTANGDFTIMLGDLTNLDAKPDSQNAEERPGFAVFGYVIDGMDVVAAIHAEAADPKETGSLAGQILANPVVITKARRGPEVAAAAEPEPAQ
ncbi:MAG: esterase-like activity of phytase family protein [Erythrobacter sp.]|uniref:esterase-like activity of phytase family protein n=1 Tax=Erythrobacter sp. TaxID=1042 RepID=UPI0032655558